MNLGGKKIKYSDNNNKLKDKHRLSTPCNLPHWKIMIGLAIFHLICVKTLRGYRPKGVWCRQKVFANRATLIHKCCKKAHVRHKIKKAYI